MSAVRIAVGVARMPASDEGATMHPRTVFAHVIFALVLLLVEASSSFAFDKAKLETFFTTNSCKYCDLTEADMSRTTLLFLALAVR